MKHNKHSLPFLLACFATAASLAGCTWDSSLYDDFVNKSTNKVTTCEGRLGITLPNGVYAYYDVNKYYCGTYDELKKTPTTCQQYIENILKNDDPEGNKIKEFGFSSFEEFEAYFEKITRFDDLCPANTESCFNLEIQPSVITILCNACPEGTAKIKKDGKIECSRCPIEEHYVQETKMCEKDDEENCGEYGYACKDHVAGWKNGECRQGKCFATGCEIGYDLNNNEGICEAKTSCTDPNTHYDNGACIQNNLENCGQHAYACAANIAGWIDGDCREGKCEASKCDTGYELIDGRCEARTSCTDPNTHYYNGECIKNNMENCGKHNHKCASITGWLKGTCTNGVCVPSECNIGYHLDEGICVADDSNNCGRVGEKCGQREVCTQGHCSNTCGSGEVRCEDKKDGTVSCADPMTSMKYCGAKKDDSCRTYETCTDGKACIGGECKQNSCTKDNETLCVVNGENVCINVSSDNADHCGACNLKCSDRPMANASSMTCSNGQCQYECVTGYTNCGTQTVPNCIDEANFQNDPNNCGGCGNKDTQEHICKKDEFCNASNCQKSTCKNQCLSNGTCVNESDKCGTQCINCNTANNASEGTCNNVTGTCTITNCARGYHKAKDNDDDSIKCVENLNEACAPIDSDEAVDCTKNATEGYCIPDGYCRVSSCKDGYKKITESHVICKCDSSVCNTNTFKHASSASCDPESEHCEVVCEKGYARVGNDGPCLCDEDAENENSCNIRNFVPATEAQCKPKDETSESELICKITCPNDYPLNDSQDACECTDDSCDNNIPPDSHIATRSCQANECVIVSCETHYSPNTDNTACVCNSDSCNKTNIKNATQASCNKDKNECEITCPNDYPLNDSQDACECTSSSSCTYPNRTCKNGECCRENTSNTTNTKPNCCSGYTCIQNKESDPIQYKCVSGNISEASWSLCSP